LVDIHTYYGASYVLQGISLKVGNGSPAVALLGRNGVGKTTTIRSIIGFTPPRHGIILFDGEDIAGLPPHTIAQRGLSLVPQGRRIFPSLSVMENLTLPMSRKEKHAAWSLDEVYSLFPILKDRAKLKGNLLSGGEQQMLSIGRALMANPKVLLLDEPSEGLAPLIVRELRGILNQLRKSGLFILLVEQNLVLALSTVDHVYILDKGIIVYESTAAELKKNEEVQVRYLGVTVQWRGTLAANRQGTKQIP
jgi:branched-chain amino acid transport system ATP-binding protein